MKILSNKVIYHDGRHNAFTSMLHWKGKYWLTFRNATHHTSNDGRIMVINSDNLENWSEAQVVIDTEKDDRDPSVFVCNDELFVISMGGCITHSSDGKNWAEPEWFFPENCRMWWVSNGPDALYASIYRQGDIGVYQENRDIARITELWRSNNGLEWEKVSVISDRDDSTEAALVFLSDKRLFAFVRHDKHDRPEIAVASPPYVEWKTVVDFDFRHNGPCMGLVGDKLVTSGRAMFEDNKTPLADDLCRERRRGLIMGVFDPDTLQWEPTLAIPHSRGVRGPGDPDAHEDSGMNWPDVSYASIMDLGDGKFVMVYYEGFKGWPSDIRAAILTM